MHHEEGKNTVLQRGPVSIADVNSNMYSSANSSSLKDVGNLLDDALEMNLCTRSQWKTVKKLTKDKEQREILLAEYERLVERKGEHDVKGIFEGLLLHAEI